MKPETAEMIRLAPTHTAKEIATLLGVSTRTVHNRLYAHRVRSKPAYTPIPYETIRHLHLAGASPAEIAARFNVPAHRIYHRLYANGDLTHRTRAHPLSQYNRFKSSVRIGKCTNLSLEVAETLMAYACKKSCTVWEAVNDLIGEMK